MFQRIRCFAKSESGQDLIEYSLLIVFVSLVAMAFLGIGRDPVMTIWTAVGGRVDAANRAATGVN